MNDRSRAQERPRAATLAQVASLAQVSEITVSRIIRNKGPIAQKTRERVMAVVRETGYVPNKVAGALASAGSNLMGVILPSLSNIVFPEVLRGVHDALGASGYQPVVGVTDYDVGVEETLVRSLLAWKPAAMIIAGFDHSPATRRMLINSGVRIAELMDIDAPALDIAVGLSHRQAGYASAQHLLARGYRRMGYVGHDWTRDLRARLRYDGFCEALAAGGAALVAQTRADGPSSARAGRDKLAELLGQAPGLDAVYFSNDDMAVGGVFHCLGAGVVVKEQLAIFGFNGLDIGEALPTPLSTVRSNRYLIGRLAVEKILEGGPRLTSPVVIDTGFEIVVGATA